MENKNEENYYETLTFKVVSNYGTVTEITRQSEGRISDVIEVFVQFLRADGFSEEWIKKYINLNELED